MKRVLVVALALVAAEAMAQTAFPTRPVSLIVGFAPGGGTDIAARIVAKQLARRPRAAGDRREPARAPAATSRPRRWRERTPDGHTIALASIGSLTVAPYLVAKLPYDPRRDLAPLTKGVSFANVLVVHPSLPVSTVAEFVALARAKPGMIGYGTSGVGGAGHLAGELFRQMAKVDIVHVPYKGGAPAMTDLLGGQILVSFVSAPSALPHIKSGKIRALATTGPTRSLSLPDMPTVAESGYPGIRRHELVRLRRAGQDARRTLIERLNRDLVKSLNTPEVREQLLNNGMEPEPSTPEALAQHIDNQLALWGQGGEGGGDPGAVTRHPTVTTIFPTWASDSM